mmetsp:Transcript_750/g.1782  ORF Transcript_750/g.1782 Transcript_750/m.1782 type:complete len:185 (-) Transcript_750:1635-2189(-)
MRGDMEWEAIENKVAGRETGYENNSVTCLLATLPAGTDATAAALQRELDPTCLLPQDAGGDASPRFVVGSLDINQGVKLPAEELVGRSPGRQDGDPRTARAYLSNVCTASAVRRMGIAAALIEMACAHARAEGVSDLYVHVAALNGPAHRLYAEVAGFELEAEETESTARRLGRARRLLLHKPL